MRSALGLVESVACVSHDCSVPGYGGEGRHQAGEVEGARTPITTDELPTIFTHCTLIIIMLHLDICIINGINIELHSKQCWDV